jgi:secondary thiamine-phosphate synthase enzyme
MITEISVKTDSKTSLVDITGKIRDAVKKSGRKNGVCYLYAPHTTAAITINENYDPTVAMDIVEEMNKLIPMNGHYKHLEGNAAAHIKSAIIGSSRSVFIENGDLVLGTWQGIFFCEFDGPRRRKVLMKITEE